MNFLKRIFSKKPQQRIESDVLMYVLESPDFGTYGMYKIASGGLPGRWGICNKCERRHRIKGDIDVHIDYYSPNIDANDLCYFIPGDSTEIIINEKMKYLLENSDLVGIKFLPVIIRTLDQIPVTKNDNLPQLYSIVPEKKVSIALSANLQLKSSCDFCGIKTYKISGPEQMIPYVDDVGDADFVGIEESGYFLISEAFKKILENNNVKNHILTTVPTVLK